MNKVYLVSSIIACSFDTMSKSFKAFKDKGEAQEYFNALVNDFIEDCMDYHECDRDELEEYHYDIDSDTNNSFCAIEKSGEQEIEIELSEMVVH